MKCRGHNAKRDANEKTIIESLERIGCEVEPIQGCEGMPDLLVALGSRLFLLEVKNPDGRNRVEKGQEEFHARFKTTIVRTIEEALEAVTK